MAGGRAGGTSRRAVDVDVAAAVAVEGGEGVVELGELLLGEHRGVAVGGTAPEVAAAAAIVVAAISERGKLKANSTALAEL